MQSSPSVLHGPLWALGANALHSCKGYLTRRTQFSGWCPPTCWTIQSALLSHSGKATWRQGKTETHQRATRPPDPEAPKPTNRASQPHFDRVSFSGFACPSDDHLSGLSSHCATKARSLSRLKGSRRGSTLTFEERPRRFLEGKGQDVLHKTTTEDDVGIHRDELANQSRHAFIAAVSSGQ